MEILNEKRKRDLTHSGALASSMTFSFSTGAAVTSSTFGATSSTFGVSVAAGVSATGATAGAASSLAASSLDGSSTFSSVLVASVRQGKRLNQPTRSVKKSMIKDLVN